MEKLPTTFDEAIEVARHNENVFNDLIHWIVKYDNETDFKELTFWKKLNDILLIFGGLLLLQI